ncbi:hypothetical protein GCM10023148_34890 [Actinokineospora soli]
MSVVVWFLVVALAVIAVLHLVWMFSPWPLRTPEEFARRVVGVELEALPSRPLTFAVVLALAAATDLDAARGGLVGAPGPEWLVAVGAGGVAVVLLGRAVQGFTASLGRDTEYARWDVRLYSPLCLLLGGLCGLVAVVG